MATTTNQELAEREIALTTVDAQGILHQLENLTVVAGQLRIAIDRMTIQLQRRRLELRSALDAGGTR